MGGSSWSHDAADYVSKARVDKPIHQIYTATSVDALVNPFGVKIRESRDSPAHPDSNGILASLDVTGSMNSLLELLARQKLPQLMKILLTKAVIPDPQILWIAQADYHGDDNPLQIGQFESGNEQDMWLTKFKLGGGGGSMGSKHGAETYDLVPYWAAKHTVMDCWEKRGRKGYLFMIGDEGYYDVVEKRAVKEIIGDDIDDDIPIAQAFEMASETFNVIKICVETPGYHHGSVDIWQKLLGEQAIYLDNPSIVCEFIAAQIAAYEGHDQDTISSSLADVGTSKQDIDKVTKALIPSARSGGIVKRGTVTGGLKTPGAKGGNTRL